MKFLKKLRKESFARMFIPMLILVGLGSLFIAESNVLEKPPKVRNLYEVPVEELEGAWVTFEVPFIYGCYGYEERTVNGVKTDYIVSKQYLIDANESYYMTLLLNAGEFALADDLLTECEAYLQGLTNRITKTFTVTGKVKKLIGERLEIYYDSIEYETLNPQEQELFLPLAVSIDSPWAVSYDEVRIGCGLILVAFVLGGCALCGMFQRKLVAKARALSNNEPEQIYEYLDYVIEKCQGIRGVFVEGSFIFGRGKIGHYLYGIQDLVWAYQRITTVKAYRVVSVGKESALVLRMADGSMKDIPMSDKDAKMVLEKIYVQFPSCAQGYSTQLEDMYRQSPDALRRVGLLQHGQHMQTE